MNELAQGGANLALVGAGLLALAAIGIGILLIVFRTRHEPTYDEVSDLTDRPIISGAPSKPHDGGPTHD